MIRQLFGFGVVGAVQLVLDWGCFVVLTALGVAVVPANIAGRVAGASMGFWLNGRYTFARTGEAGLGRQQVTRYLLFWLAMTLVSTAAMRLLESHHGLASAWLAKPVVDGLLAGVGFLVSKYWIYR